MNRELISLREFSRRIGVTDKAIRDAIKAGKLKKCVSKDGKGNPQIISDIGIIEARNNGMGKRSKGFQEQIAKAEAEQFDDKPEEIKPENTGLLTYEQALRKKENQIAAIKELEYLEKKGTLVNKKDVYKALFEFGQNVRQEFEIIPDRIIDTILAAKDRNEAYNTLRDEIEKALLILSQSNDLKIEKR